MSSVTDELLRLLDERGVEYRFNESTKVFEWHFEGTDGEGSAHATEVDGGVNIIACSLTPEQAIAATLGPREQPPHDQLQAENAKLRTALIAVLQCNGITKRDKGCDACPMYDKEKEYVWAGDWCGIKRFISELGIEVDG